MVRTSRTTERHLAGCSKSLSGKAAASKEARRTLRYVEPLSEARTTLADFFSILLEGPPGGANQIKIVGEQLTDIVNTERHHRHAIEPQSPRNNWNSHAQR